MATNSYEYDSGQSAANYVNKRGINALFEAMMTALMVHKPVDHITFMRKCLDKAEVHPNHIHWDFFVTKSVSFSLNQKRQKSLPPIEHTKPIVFILRSIRLCSRLLECYHQINYLLISDFEDILASTIHYFDQLFPPDIFLPQHFPLMSLKSNDFNLPIIFCVDNHRISIKENDLLIDDEFEMINEEENNNSFVDTLCQRLAEQFSFKNIHYGDFNRTFWDFQQLKNEIFGSMSTCPGYIIDNFPTSFDDLQKFHTEVKIGPCSALIYIGDYQTVTQLDELNGIIEKFKENQKAIYVNCLMEVDEIYEDLKSKILEHI